MKNKELVLDIFLKQRKKGQIGIAMHDAVTQKTWDYIYNKAKLATLKEVFKDIDEDINILYYYSLRQLNAYELHAELMRIIKFNVANTKKKWLESKIKEVEK